MANPFCYVELHTTDTKQAKEFYGKLLDWEWQAHDMGGMIYDMFVVGEGGIGGGLTTLKAPEGTPPHWLPYILVDDVAEKTVHAEDMGAEVLMGKTEVPNMGWFSVIKDPTGAVVALWQETGK